MSLVLNQSTLPEGLTVKTFGHDQTVYFNATGIQIEMSMSDFCDMVAYVLSNTDLMPSDPRRELLARITSGQKVRGYNEGGHRFSM